MNIEEFDKEMISAFDKWKHKIDNKEAPNWMLWIPLVLTVGTFLYMMIKL